MKVLDLRCGNEHLFEGWFASDDDFQQQGDKGLVECPLCADKAIVRLPSAPRLNVTRLHEADVPVSKQARMQSLYMQAVRHVINSTEDVGDRFPEEARRIHYGEIEERGIRGHASAEDAHALREEGIEVMALPIPAAAKGTVQ